jgi:hypothetical protein
MPSKSIYLIQPFGVGKDKRSTAMIWPSAIIKDVQYEVERMLFLLRVDGPNSFHLKIINEKQLTEEMISAQEFTTLQSRHHLRNR